MTAVMNLADPELELIDPTPNVHTLFVHFDQLFFWTKLAGRALVRWSKRMYSCAGVCSYEGRGGLCDIALSEPLLKLRPRKDLIETLLHEMIHAFLFITNRDNDRDGHGPNFLAHMHRINRSAGLNISVYHDFHDEVNLYLTHWWRCDGPCQKMKPYFGTVRRSANRAPGPSDYWWETHKRKCGGKFVKIQEPEKPAKKSSKTKPNADITKYLNNNNGKTDNKNRTNGVLKTNSIKGLADLQSDVHVPIKAVVTPKKLIQPPLFTGSGQTLIGKSITNSVESVTEIVRNIWANKQIPPAINAIAINTTAKHAAKTGKPAESSRNKHKADPVIIEPPPKKIKKIDDYFKATASDILKDVYGQEFTITQSSDSNKLKAVTFVQNNDSNTLKQIIVGKDFVDCPICKAKVDSSKINRHIDECLNKDVIEKLSKETIVIIPSTSKINEVDGKLKQMVGEIQKIPAFKYKTENNKTEFDIIKNKKEPSNVPEIAKTYEDIYNTNHIEKSKTRKTDFIISKEEKEFKPDIKIKSEPSTSQDGLTNDQRCPCCGNKVDKPIQEHIDECLVFFGNNTTKPEEKKGFKPDILIKSEPTTSQDGLKNEQNCPCCGNKVDKPIQEHLDECLMFFDNNTTIPEQGASTSLDTIVIDDDDDEFDETMTYNATGTKSPCPCCLQMIENAEMNNHLDVCLS